MKVKLLNDGNYTAACESIEFPVVVEAIRYEGHTPHPTVFVSCSELIRVGGNAEILEDPDLADLIFVGDEFEVIEE